MEGRKKSLKDSSGRITIRNLKLRNKVDGPKRIHVGLLHADKLHLDNHYINSFINNLSFKERIDIFCEEANRFLGAIDQVVDDENICFFIAPEYFFAKIYDKDDQRYTFYTKNEVRDILHILAYKTKEIKNTILIPGTVNMDCGDKLVSTVFVFYEGEIIFKYNKKSYDSASNLKKFNQSIDLNQPQVFIFKGLKIGVDICLDHDEKYLAQSVDAPLDIGILISNTNRHSFSSNGLEKIPVRDGGIFIHCDYNSAEEYSGVWMLARGVGTHGNTIVHGIDKNDLAFNGSPRGVTRSNVKPFPTANTYKWGVLSKDAKITVFEPVFIAINKPAVYEY